MNNSIVLKIIELRRGGIGKDASLMAQCKTMETEKIPSETTSKDKL